MRIVQTALFALALTTTAAQAQDCADLSQLPTGQFNGATLQFQSHGALDLMKGSFFDGASFFPGGVVLVRQDLQCGSTAGTGLELRLANVRGILSDPSVTEVIVEFCRFADGGNLGAFLFGPPTFVPDLTSVSMLSLQGPFSTTATADTVSTISGADAAVKIAGQTVTQFEFGGPEVFVASICVN